MSNSMARSNLRLALVGLIAVTLLGGCGLFEVEKRKHCFNPDCSAVDAGQLEAGSGGVGGGSGAAAMGGTASGGTGGELDGATDANMSMMDAMSDVHVDDGGGAGDGATSACAPCPRGKRCDAASGECVECIKNTHCKTAAAPACDLEQHACVACNEDNDCSAPKPACDTEHHACVQCNEGKDCSGDTPLCNPSQHACVQCLDDGDCTDPTAAHCNAGTCAPCADDSECAHFDHLRVCDSSSGSGQCVQCTGIKYDECGAAGAGKPYVCDSKAKTCTMKQAGSAQPCQPCVSDAHCRAGTACIQTTFGPSDADTGSFCLWKKNATGSSAPNGNCSNVRPFVGTESSWNSIDGNKPTVCKPARTTCQAQNDFLNKSCSGATQAGDAECGADGVDDAYCAPFNNGFYCTVPCVSFLDCKDTRPGDDMECQSQMLGSSSVDVCQFQ